MDFVGLSQLPEGSRARWPAFYTASIFIFGDVGE